jgi:hypothetical protein
MSPVRSIKNQYLGVNAHLHSHLQAGDEWNSFHNRHVGDLLGALRTQILPLGYTARMEHLRTISIYPLGRTRGVPIALVELLSPSHKPGHGRSSSYEDWRMTLLDQGSVLVEIDYLHESAPTLSAVQNYSSPDARERPDAHAFRFAIIDPRPSLAAGKSSVIEFDVDALIPNLKLPLEATDTLDFDMGQVYRKTYEEMAFGLESVDYAVLPRNFDRYSRADQTRIARRMVAVLEAAARGDKLNGDPLPASEMPLDEALAQIKRMSSEARV